MFRRVMAPEAGMLFVFPEAQEQVFWMKNTYLPLDMIFIKQDGSILSIAERAVPLTETPVPSHGDAKARRARAEWRHRRAARHQARRQGERTGFAAMTEAMARETGWIGTASRVAAVLLIAGGALALYAERGLVEPRSLLALLQQHSWAPAAFLIVHVAASLLFVPRTIIAVTGGLLFGLWWGTALTLLGSMLGAAAGFAMGRYLHAGLRHYRPGARARGLLQRLERGGWRTVMFFRLVPIMPHTPVNYARRDARRLGRLSRRQPARPAADHGGRGQRRRHRRRGDRRQRQLAPADLDRARCARRVVAAAAPDAATRRRAAGAVRPGVGDSPDPCGSRGSEASPGAAGEICDFAYGFISCRNQSVGISRPRPFPWRRGRRRGRSRQIARQSRHY